MDIQDNNIKKKKDQQSKRLTLDNDVMGIEEQKIIKKIKENVNPYTNRNYSKQYFSLLEDRKKLPAFEAKKELQALIKKYQTIVLQGETGSGKTTQVPQFLLEFGYGSGDKGICCTQPRRVAAMSVAKRVAEEMDVTLGEQVGYSIRFEDKTSRNTKLKYLTDGMLLREAMNDPLLEKYSVVIIDEAHERTLNTDVLFGLLKEVLKARGDSLKLVVMSATLDAQKFQEYFDGAPLLDIPGRLHPVEIYYTQQPENDYLEAAIKTTLYIHSTEKQPGDILLFLTGEEEIEQACREIRVQCQQLGDSVGPMSVIPLYSSLPPKQQQKIFEEAPRSRKGLVGRKCVVATNIAETSLTIDGVVFVIDPGFAKQKVFNPRMRVESLLVCPVSKASAKQRAGRAGRTKPGKCYRLYTEATFKQELIENTYPEILRSNLAGTVLQLKRLGIEDLVHFDFMDPPAPETLMRALELLNYLGALDDEGELTPLGHQMSEFPLDPQLSKALIASSTPPLHCSQEMLIIAAVISVPMIFLRPKDQQQQADAARAQFVHVDGDHLTLLQVYQSYQQWGQHDPQWCHNNYLNNRALKQAQDIVQQLTQIFHKLNMSVLQCPQESNFHLQKHQLHSYDQVKRAILSGYFMQIAHLQKNNVYQTVKDSNMVLIHPSSVLTRKPLFVMYQDFVLTKKNYIRTILDIQPDWLLQTPGVIREYFDPRGIKNIDTRKELERVERELIANQKRKKIIQ